MQYKQASNNAWLKPFLGQWHDRDGVAALSSKNNPS